MEKHAAIRCPRITSARQCVDKNSRLWAARKVKNPHFSYIIHIQENVPKKTHERPQKPQSEAKKKRRDK